MSTGSGAFGLHGMVTEEGTDVLFDCAEEGVGVAGGFGGLVGHFFGTGKGQVSVVVVCVVGVFVVVVCGVWC